MIRISEIKECDGELLASVNELLPQLSASSVHLSEADFVSLISSEGSRVFVAKDEDVVIGMLSLVVFSIPTGIKAWIEDVVVDEKARGKGVGKLLMEHALKLAESLGAKSVDLTSRPSREVANKLYRSLGYELRDTNVYRYKFS